MICSGFQCCQSASVTNPDSLQNTLGNAASRADSLRPGIDLAALDRRLGQMIEHETLPRKPLDEFGRHRKMFRVDQNVVGEIELFQHRNATKKIRLQQESGRPAPPARCDGCLPALDF